MVGGNLIKYMAKAILPAQIRNYLRRKQSDVALSMLPRAGAHFIQQNPTFNTDPSLNYFPEFFDLYEEYEGQVSKIYGGQRKLMDGNRVLQLLLFQKLVWNLPEGDYAELGTFRGYFARMIWLKRNPAYRLYCFDTFEGFTQEDAEVEIENTGIEVEVGKGFSDTTEEATRGYITDSDGKDSDMLITRKGWFPATFAGLENNKWRFVHLDADLYRPTIAGLELFWPSLVPGGVLVMHDFSAGFVGVRKAADEFFSPLGITPVPLCDGTGSAVVIKKKDLCR